MTKEELIKIAKEKEACKNGLEWMEDHEIEDLKSRNAVYLGYWYWAWKNAPECRDQIRHDKLVLDKLINDGDCDVRIAVAKQGYGLNKLINDEHYFVRRAVAEQGYGLNKLIKDEDWLVRRAVAEQGYGLNKLINDEDVDVREAAEIKLKDIKQND